MSFHLKSIQERAYQLGVPAEALKYIDPEDPLLDHALIKANGRWQREGGLERIRRGEKHEKPS